MNVQKVAPIAIKMKKTDKQPPLYCLFDPTCVCLEMYRPLNSWTKRG